MAVAERELLEKIDASLTRWMLATVDMVGELQADIAVLLGRPTEIPPAAGEVDGMGADRYGPRSAPAEPEWPKIQGSWRCPKCKRLNTDEGPCCEDCGEPTGPVPLGMWLCRKCNRLNLRAEPRCRCGEDLYCV